MCIKAYIGENMWCFHWLGALITADTPTIPDNDQGLQHKVTAICPHSECIQLLGADCVSHSFDRFISTSEKKEA